MSDLAALAKTLAAHPHVTGKRDIDIATERLGLTQLSPGRPGDDAAALPEGDGWHLMAMEGFINEFVADAPWFAGWCAVMVNVSDIAAMGGRATALTNAIWAPDAETASEIFRGMQEASAAYNVPIVGGHTNLRSDKPQLAASIWGKANSLITSFDAAPGDVLIAAIDHRGAYAGETDNFPAFLNAPHARLRGDLELLPEAVESGLVTAGKDISQGGIAGTSLMLAECSGVGIEICVDAIPLPDGADRARWMTTFPSFGFLLTAKPENVTQLCSQFEARDITVAQIGRVTEGGALTLKSGGECATFWDHRKTPYLGLAPEREVAHA